MLTRLCCVGVGIRRVQLNCNHIFGPAQAVGAVVVIVILCAWQWLAAAE
jgi:hypothetical protein